MSDREIIAMIAYLQRLGKDIKVKPVVLAPVAETAPAAPAAVPAPADSSAVNPQ